MFVVPVKRRNSLTIEEIFKRYVAPGSIVYTDSFKSYFRVCKERKLEHHTVNHTLTYNDKVTGVHTNTV